MVEVLKMVKSVEFIRIKGPKKAQPQGTRPRNLPGGLGLKSFWQSGRGEGDSNAWNWLIHCVVSLLQFLVPTTINPIRARLFYVVCPGEGGGKNLPPLIFPGRHWQSKSNFLWFSIYFWKIYLLKKNWKKDTSIIAVICISIVSTYRKTCQNDQKEPIVKLQ